MIKAEKTPNDNLRGGKSGCWISKKNKKVDKQKDPSKILDRDPQADDFQNLISSSLTTDNNNNNNNANIV